MRLYAEVDAFLNCEEEFSVEDLRAWYPELLELHDRLTVLYEANSKPIHARPNKALAKRLAGIDRLLSRAAMVGVLDDEGYVVYCPVAWS
jgi:hypothetical protein